MSSVDKLYHRQLRRERRLSRRLTRRALNEPPVRPVLEEVGNAVTHGVGALLSIAALVLMLVRAASPKAVLSAAIYGACLIFLFTMSCLYHAFPAGSRVKRLWRRFDYCSIYLLIGGTFAPLWLLFWGGVSGWVLFALQWAVITCGITFVAVFGPGVPRMKRLHMTLYMVIGWSGLLFLPRMFREAPLLFGCILGGGVVYSLGMIPFAIKKRGAHFLWHFFVLLGAGLQWLGIYLTLY